MNQEEFKQGCNGLCLLGGVCVMVDKWLEENFTPDKCTITQHKYREQSYCHITIKNYGVAKAVFPDYKKMVNYEQLVAGLGLGIYCWRGHVEIDVPVPKREEIYWEKEISKLAKEIETFYEKPSHEHGPFTHIHATYRDPSEDGFKKFTDLIKRMLGVERPEISEEEENNIEHIQNWE